MSAINTTDGTSNFNHSNGLSLLEEQHSNSRTVSELICILIFAIALVITICVSVLKFINWRCTHWRKFHERGCSYDITTYLIIENELDIKFEKENIQKGIQKKIDRRIYDVTSRYYENIVRHDEHFRFKGKNINIQQTNEMCKNFSKHPGILYAVHGLSTRTHIHKNLMLNKKRDSDTNRNNMEKGYSESDKSNDESIDDSTSFSDANSEKQLCNNHSVTNIHPQTYRQNRIHKTSASEPCDTEIQTRHSSKQVRYHKIK